MQVDDFLVVQVLDDVMQDDRGRQLVDVVWALQWLEGFGEVVYRQVSTPFIDFWDDEAQAVEHVRDALVVVVRGEGDLEDDVSQ